jgi:hypothetical protein
LTSDVVKRTNIKDDLKMTSVSERWPAAVMIKNVIGKVKTKELK